MRQCSSPPVNYMSHETSHVALVTRHPSYVTCHMSHVTCNLCLVTPSLILIQTTIVVYCKSIDSVANLKSATYFRFLKISNFYIFEILTFIIHTFAITPCGTFVFGMLGRWLRSTINVFCCIQRQKKPYC